VSVCLCMYTYSKVRTRALVSREPYVTRSRERALHHQSNIIIEILLNRNINIVKRARHHQKEPYITSQSSEARKMTPLRNALHHRKPLQHTLHTPFSKSYTLYPTPYTLQQILHPIPYTLYPTPSTPYTLNPQPHSLNANPNPVLSTLNPTP